jgi:hypothetical protein
VLRVVPAPSKKLARARNKGARASAPPARPPLFLAVNSAHVRDRWAHALLAAGARRAAAAAAAAARAAAQ